MAAERAPTELQGRRSDWLRSVDHLEAGVRADTERLSSSSRTGVHATIWPRGHNLHPFRAWAILAFIILNIGAVAATWYLHWR